MRLTRLSRSVRGKTLITTGAASGMGRATAQLFADEGAQVAVTDRDGDGAERVAAEIRAAGGSAEAWTLDLMRAPDIERTVAAVAERFGAIDIVVNNAGAVLSRPIDDAGYEAAWEASLQLMLHAQMRVVRTALKRYGDPEEVAHATLSLALPAASFITGVALPVDGGLTVRNA